MKNLFKFGFLGLALTIGMAACNNTPKEEAAQEVEETVENVTEELEAAADSLEAAADSVVDSLENVQ